MRFKQRFTIQFTILAAIGLAACAEPDPAPADTADGSQGLEVDVSVAECKVAADCPLASKPCHAATCSADGLCGTAPASDGSPCSDDDPCTEAVACKSGVCAGPSTCACKADGDCKAFEDGDACNGTLFCDASVKAPVCVVLPSSVITCSDATDTACSANQCEPATGTCAQKARSDGKACDDGDVCTGQDACAAGTCVGKGACACKADADCAAFDDGNPCTGTLYCADLGSPSAACKVNPATVVACDPSDDGPCESNQCQAKDGSCKLAAKADGSGCDLDGSTCSLDVCLGGACKPGALAEPCDCKTDTDCSAFDDGNLCNGKLFCSKASGHCELNPATVVTCPTVSDTACLTQLCNPKSGQCQLTTSADGAACDDGWTCSVGDHCQKGACVAGKGDCACKTTSDCEAFAGSNACAKLYCDKPAGICKVNPATLKDCDEAEDPACSDMVCKPATGKCVAVPKNEGLPCEADGTWCTNLDICKGGSCQAAKSKCPCQADADCLAMDDGNACNGTLYCDKPSGSCLPNPATVKTCPGDAGLCKTFACDPKSGTCATKAKVEGAACDSDGFVCTLEACSGGSCALQSEGCLCWDDADCAPFEDGDACNGKLYCDKTAGPPACKLNPASVVTCSQAGVAPCQTKKCNPANGLCDPAVTPDGTPCPDASACTSGEVCKSGSCATTAVVCNDSNPCTVDSCDPVNGCVFAPAANLAPCDDGNACTDNDSCQKGACKGPIPVDCDDGDLCTKDACDPKAGCSAAGQVGMLCPNGICGPNVCVVDAKRTIGASSSSQGYAVFAGATLGWGRNVHGMLPAQVTGEGPHPPVVLSPKDLRLVGASESRACGVDGMGALTCWGRNDKGVAFAPVKVATPVPIVQVTGHADTVLLLGNDGAVYTLGPLSAPPAVSKLVTVQGGKPFIQIASGDGVGCALQEGGAPYCWGGNDFGQLGQGAGKATNGTPASQPLSVALKGVVDLCAGSGFVCALDDKGAVRCWGAGESGQLGDGQAKNASAPVLVKDTDKAPPIGPGAKALRCAPAHACLQAADGRVLCWGDNARGALGVGDTAPRSTPTAVVKEDKVVFKLAGGKLMTTNGGGCVFGGGSAHCWGDDADGLLGLWQAGTGTDPLIPAQVRKADGSKLVGVTSLVGGEGAFCAAMPSDPKDIESASDWLCWGDNEGGITGLQGAFERTLQVATPVPMLAGATTVAVTPDEGCRVLVTGGFGKLSCWGRNLGGATLGIDDGKPVAAPQVLDPILDPNSVVRSANHACAVIGSGQPTCWGQGGFGALGTGSTPKSAPPQPVTWFDGLTSLSIGPFHSCATNLMSAAKCWGDNSFGALGLGTKGAPVSSPSFVTGNLTLTHIAVGSLHTCALDDTGKVYCFGLNGGTMNALGLEKEAIADSPTPGLAVGIGGIGQPKAKSITLGNAASCIIDQTDVAHCWGNNALGQLGFGTHNLIGFDKQPGTPLGLPKVKNIVFGAFAGCAQTLETGTGGVLKSEIWCWGSRAGGQTGRGVHLRPHVIVRVLPVAET